MNGHVDERVKFIAEVSSNHAQDIDRCFDFIKIAADIGCDAVKFQLFKVDQLFSPEILSRSEEHFKRRAWELPLSFVPRLAEHCDKYNIEFICTPFYLSAVDELLPYVSSYKVASYELLWDALLTKCAETDKPVILSTGMADMSEVTHAAEMLSSSGCKDITLLHCVSAYPTPPPEANLATMKLLGEKTGCKIGWSDHTREPGVIHRAIHKWGARVIEFHLDLDGEGDEYEAGHCWLPEEIGYVIRDVRLAFTADGVASKEASPSELKDRLWRADPEDGLRPLKQIRDEYLKSCTGDDGGSK